jgi:pathogenesis-related protein 1
VRVDSSTIAAGLPLRVDHRNELYFPSHITMPLLAAFFLESIMRHALWFLMLLAVTSDAQWRHFGDGQTTVKPSSLARDMLAAHNEVRGRVRVAPLAWSDRLAADAQDWADTLLKRRQFIHRPNSPYGENLFEVTGASASTAQVVKMWADESRDYDYNSNKCRGACGHYTQIVWGDTKVVGCGVARGAGGEIWVCDYDPPGNVIGRRPY